MKPQAIIFDCDGTLVDSESVPATAGSLGAELPVARAARLHRALGWLVKIDVLRPAPEDFPA